MSRLPFDSHFPVACKYSLYLLLCLGLSVWCILKLKTNPEYLDGLDTDVMVQILESELWSDAVSVCVILGVSGLDDILTKKGGPYQIGYVRVLSACGSRCSSHAWVLCLPGWTYWTTTLCPDTGFVRSEKPRDRDTHRESKNPRHTHSLRIKIKFSRQGTWYHSSDQHFVPSAHSGPSH